MQYYESETRILIIGSGAREHALGKKIKDGKPERRIFFLPGNGGTKTTGTNITHVSPSDFDSVLQLIMEYKIQLVVVGPEKPLVDGLTDFLRENSIAVFGPSKEASKIESDKSFAKKLMIRAGVPTASFKEFSRSEYQEALEFIEQHALPVVIKASGLAAGKGVIIADTVEEAKVAVTDIFENNIFGDAGDTIVVEEFMKGEEASVFAVTDGESFALLPPAQDHKRIGNNDTGKNTGGMGAYSPAVLVNDSTMQIIAEKIIRPVLHQMKMEGYLFSGCLYAGLMLTDNGPKVVEFNCRFGDPETQSVMEVIEGDFLKLLTDSAAGKVEPGTITYNGMSSVTVVTASSGYPGTFETGYEISGLDQLPEDVTVYHAGTNESEGKILTSGGRVLSITGVSRKGCLSEAIKKTYSAVEKISYKNIYYRNDIGEKGLKYSGD
ncbi:MAG: phosphoribosylamine--glycine ligase [Ignavibacteriaceae bacterium]|nr:phosphoribosylamine--glycine ligase [Ignavibacteriaceae bacterium]